MATTVKLKTSSIHNYCANAKTCCLPNVRTSIYVDHVQHLLRVIAVLSKNLADRFACPKSECDRFERSAEICKDCWVEWADDRIGGCGL